MSTDPTKAAVIERWTCDCGTRHDLAVVQRCSDCLDFAPGYHWRPTPKPYWWDSRWIREQRVQGGLASAHERADHQRNAS